jgi:hypothetical protein
MEKEETLARKSAPIVLEQAGMRMWVITAAPGAESKG